jgi:hypothetical protein
MSKALRSDKLFQTVIFSQAVKVDCVFFIFNQFSRLVLVIFLFQAQVLIKKSSVQVKLVVSVCPAISTLGEDHIGLSQVQLLVNTCP